MRLIAVGCVLAAFAGCQPKDGIADTRPDEPAFRIVLSDGPKPWEKTAAEEPNEIRIARLVYADVEK